MDRLEILTVASQLHSPKKYVAVFRSNANFYFYKQFTANFLVKNRFFFFISAQNPYVLL